jgi:hypothetical protein
MTHELNDNQQLVEALSVSPSIRGTRRNDTHLTVYWSGGIEFIQVEDYEHEGAQACQGVNLLDR